MTHTSSNRTQLIARARDLVKNGGATRLFLDRPLDRGHLPGDPTNARDQLSPVG